MHPMEHKALFLGVLALIMPAVMLFFQLTETTEFAFNPITVARLYVQTFWLLLVTVGVGVGLYWVVLRPAEPRLRKYGLLSATAYFFAQLMRFVGLFFVDTILPTVPRGSLSNMPDIFGPMFIAIDIAEVLIPVALVAFGAICAVAFVAKRRGGSPAA